MLKAYWYMRPVVVLVEMEVVEGQLLLDIHCSL